MVTLPLQGTSHLLLDDQMLCTYDTNDAVGCATNGCDDYATSSDAARVDCWGEVSFSFPLGHPIVIDIHLREIGAADCEGIQCEKTATLILSSQSLLADGGFTITTIELSESCSGGRTIHADFPITIQAY